MTRPMELCHGRIHRPIPLSATRRYTWEDIRRMCKRVSGPYWMRVEGKLIPLQNESNLQLACRASSAYHDWVAYNVPEEDGFSEDMAEREQRIIAEMAETSEDTPW